MPWRKISFSDDIGIGAPLNLVLDTKYVNAEKRNQFGGLSYRNHHIYQIGFYALSFRCEGVLIYPRVDRDIDVVFEVDGVRIRILTVELQEDGLPGLNALIHLFGN